MNRSTADGLASLTPPGYDRPRLLRAVEEMILALGLDPNDENLLETPRRVTDMYAELFGGLSRDPKDDLSVNFPAEYDEMVIVRDIPFYSLCAHHFVPFFGHATVAYLPHDRVVGLSKLARVVETYGRRPQLQERLTTQIADAMMDVLQPKGCAVVIKARHLCMEMRGIKKPDALTVTSANRGLFRTNSATRAEFMALLDR